MDSSLSIPITRRGIYRKSTKPALRTSFSPAARHCNAGAPADTGSFTVLPPHNWLLHWPTCSTCAADEAHPLVIARDRIYSSQGLAVGFSLSEHGGAVANGSLEDFIRYPAGVRDVDVMFYHS
jgi:hypothetical protein